MVADNLGLSGPERAAVVFMIARARSALWLPGSEYSRVRGAHYELDTGDAVPVKQHEFRRSAEQVADVEWHIGQAVALGTLEPCVGSWATPAFVVGKKGKPHRWLVCDYRKVNLVTRRMYHPTPAVVEVIRHVCGATLFFGLGKCLASISCYCHWLPKRSLLSWSPLVCTSRLFYQLDRWTDRRLSLLSCVVSLMECLVSKSTSMTWPCLHGLQMRHPHDLTGRSGMRACVRRAELGLVPVGYRYAVNGRVTWGGRHGLSGVSVVSLVRYAGNEWILFWIQYVDGFCCRCIVLNVKTADYVCGGGGLLL